MARMPRLAINPAASQPFLWKLRAHAFRIITAPDLTDLFLFHSNGSESWPSGAGRPLTPGIPTSRRAYPMRPFFSLCLCTVFFRLRRGDRANFRSDARAHPKYCAMAPNSHAGVEVEEHIRHQQDAVCIDRPATGARADKAAHPPRLVRWLDLSLHFRPRRDGMGR